MNLDLRPVVQMDPSMITWEIIDRLRMSGVDGAQDRTDALLANINK